MLPTLQKLTFLMIFVSAPAAAIAKPDHVVLGYSAAWRDASAEPGDYDWAGLTHLARAFLKPSSDGSITVPDGYFNPTLELLARRHGVKLLMSLGGGSIDASRWVSIGSHPVFRQRLLDTLAALMSANHYDGVDVDWEPSPATTAEGDAYISLLQALRSRFPHAILTTALTTDESAVHYFPFQAVVDSVDYVNVMTYDYSGPWGGVAGHATNLRPAGDYPALAEHSVEEGMQNLLRNHHAPPAKLLLGMNFWAYRYRVDHIGNPFKKNADNVYDDLSYQQVQSLIATGLYQSIWDTRAAAPYLQREGGGSVVVYDNPKSVGLKCDYAKGLGCAGVMIWNVGADNDGSSAPLMDAIVHAFGGTPRKLNRDAIETQVKEIAEELQNGASPPNPPVPAPLQSLSDAQLNDLFVRLQKSQGPLADRLWRDKGSGK